MTARPDPGPSFAGDRSGDSCRDYRSIRPPSQCIFRPENEEGRTKTGPPFVREVNSRQQARRRTDGSSVLPGKLNLLLGHGRSELLRREGDARLRPGADGDLLRDGQGLAIADDFRLQRVV